MFVVCCRPDRNDLFDRGVFKRHSSKLSSLTVSSKQSVINEKKSNEKSQVVELNQLHTILSASNLNCINLLRFRRGFCLAHTKYEAKKIS